MNLTPNLGLPPSWLLTWADFALVDAFMASKQTLFDVCLAYKAAIRAEVSTLRSRPMMSVSDGNDGSA